MRVYRVYKAMKLNPPGRTKRRLPKRVQQPMVIEARANAECSLGFMPDTLYQGRSLRALNVLDEGVPEALDIVIDTLTPGVRVVRPPDRLIEWGGKPDAIRVDKNQRIYLRCLSTGAATWPPSLFTYNRVNRTRMRISNASIGPTDPSC